MTANDAKNVAAELAAVIPSTDLITGRAALQPFECDALTMYKTVPLCAVLPSTEASLVDVLRTCHRLGVPVVTRGAGTGLSGGANPHEHGVLLITSRLNTITHIDPLARTAIVQPGVRNLALSNAVSRHGLFYAPDPSSQVACTVGGNVAENSGGVRCLKYGLTVHNVESLRCYGADGTEFTVGGPAATGYDLLALLHGSEGLLAVIVEATVILTPKPEVTRTVVVAFDTVNDVGEAVAGIIAAGITPAGLEMMDHLSVELVEEFADIGYPAAAAAILICETDGLVEDADDEMARLTQLCLACGGHSIKIAANDVERTKIWLGRKSALPAVGRRCTDYYCVDGTIPRQQIGLILERIGSLSDQHGLPCANVFHAGDGNLHPLIMFNAGDPDQVKRAKHFGSDILLACLKVGGTVTGEHGVGIEKLNEMCVQFTPAELECYHQLKLAFDPSGLLNPGKAIPTLQRCAEFGAMHIKSGQEPFPHLERF